MFLISTIFLYIYIFFFVKNSNALLLANTNFSIWFRCEPSKWRNKLKTDRCRTIMRMSRINITDVRLAGLHIYIFHLCFTKITVLEIILRILNSHYTKTLIVKRNQNLTLQNLEYFENIYKFWALKNKYIIFE